jgi:hypothetical protein
LNIHLTELQEHLAASFRFWGKLGYGDGIAGHITVRDPVLEGHYWLAIPIDDYFPTFSFVF